MNEITPGYPEIKNLPDAIIVDLDGTLLNSQHHLSMRNRQAIERCRTLGIPVVVATSRPERSVRRFLGPELTDGVSRVVLNGALAMGVAPLTGRYAQVLDAPLVLAIVGMVCTLHPAAIFTIELDGMHFATNAQMDDRGLWRHFSATRDLVYPLHQAVSRSVLKVAVNGQGESLSDTAARLQETFGPQIVVVPALTGRFLNITAVNASKEGAIEQLLLSQQRSISNAWAFGDDVPDLGMLRKAGIAVAMANAEPAVKAIATYVTAHHDEDGVAQCLEQWLPARGV
jgi:Cof subfamily protein (haloacid dehalogenase superfamily)